MTPVWISLGSNLGNRRAILDEALVLLGRTAGITVAAVSSYHETKPVGGPAGQGPFLNAAAHLFTTLTPTQLLAATQAIETDLGRVRTVRWGERTLDLDLLIYGSRFVDEPDLQLPHPRLAVRRFVLEPLSEIAPGCTDTVHRWSVRALLENLNRQPRVLMLDETLVGDNEDLPHQIATRLGASLLTHEPSQDSEPFQPLGWNAHSKQSSRLAQILGAVDAYHHWFVAGDLSASGWTVIDFSLDILLLQEQWLLPANPRSDNELVATAALERPQFELKLQIAQRLAHLPGATLIVSRVARKPGRARTPHYHPEATTVAALAAEIHALCRGISPS